MEAFIPLEKGKGTSGIRSFKQAKPQAVEKGNKNVEVPMLLARKN